MKNRLMFVIVAGWLAINAIQTADAQQNRGEHVIADFEGEKAVAGNKTTHKANVSVVKDAPAGGGKSAAKTVVDSAAQASKFFGTGFRFSPVDLSATGEIKFWIKTEIKSDTVWKNWMTSPPVKQIRFPTCRLFRPANIQRFMSFWR